MDTKSNDNSNTSRSSTNSNVACSCHHMSHTRQIPKTKLMVPCSSSSKFGHIGRGLLLSQMSVHLSSALIVLYIHLGKSDRSGTTRPSLVVAYRQPEPGLHRHFHHRCLRCVKLRLGSSERHQTETLEHRSIAANMHRLL